MTGQRSTPDVAFDANPNTGVEIYFTPGVWWRRLANDAARLMGGGWRDKPGHAGLGSHHRDRRSGSGRRPGEPGRLHADVAVALRRSLVRLQHGLGRSLIIRRRRRVRLRVRVRLRCILVLFIVWRLKLFGASATTSSSSTGANTATGLGSPNGPALVSHLAARTPCDPSDTSNRQWGRHDSESPLRPQIPEGGVPDINLDIAPPTMAAARSSRARPIPKPRHEVGTSSSARCQRSCRRSQPEGLRSDGPGKGQFAPRRRGQPSAVHTPVRRDQGVCASLFHQRHEARPLSVEPLMGIGPHCASSC